MSVRTRVDAPRRGGQTTQRRGTSRRVHDQPAAGASARRRTRSRRGPVLPPLPGRSMMSGRIPFVVAILVLLGCGLMCTLLLTTRSAEDSYQLSDARRINQQLSDEQAELQRQVAAADAAPELATRARELGMIPAKDPARLVVAPNGAVTVIGKETAQSGPPAPPLNTTPAAPTPANPAQGQGERIVPVTALPNQNPADENAAPTSAQPTTTAPVTPTRNPSAAAQAPTTPATPARPAPNPASPAPAARVDQTVPVQNPVAPAATPLPAAGGGQ
ncbi:hypothetical protein [Nocardia macrotermitis]|uniref:Cell division protein FtsL n=1 Tax=Nocardia macrotermitis TaxID=2585198 RepID=A0A7K0D6A8_9NOCA|nr:hypothetical protein [Nocardia macrotermitis]MQY21296.1 hypothetical protein [Nocardia macrotermitis]